MRKRPKKTSDSEVRLVVVDCSPVLTGEAKGLYRRILPFREFIRRNGIRLTPEDGETAAVDVGEFLEVACFEQRLFEVLRDGNDAVRLHEGDIGDGERSEDVLGCCFCSGAAVGCDGDIALSAAEDGEFVDDGGDRIVHDGECGRRTRVRVRDGADIAAASIDRGVHHQLAGRFPLVQRFDGVSVHIDDDNVVGGHLRAVHARRRDAYEPALGVADAEIPGAMPAQTLAVCLQSIAPHVFFDLLEHNDPPRVCMSYFSERSQDLASTFPYV